jgi:2-amino-4-hydroxy-6-hydroxymethyldihydropteridine diphosphokinase
MNLREAVTALKQAGVRVTRQSSLYETEPVDYLAQAWFLNCVVEGQTVLPSVSLLHELRAIESRMGSSKPFAKGPRLLDMDLLLYGNETILTPELQVPHPRMTERRFVLVPLAEIAPQMKHPSWSFSAADLLANCSDTSKVSRVKDS